MPTRKDYGMYLCKLTFFSDYYGFSPNIRFTFKCLIMKNATRTVVISLIVSTFVLSYQLRIFEIIYYRQLGLIDFDQYFQSVWVIIITICTVGFGDLVPFSPIGRIIIIITSFWGAFIMLLIVVAANLFNLSSNQKKAMHHLFLTRKASLSIISALRYNLYVKKLEN